MENQVDLKEWSPVRCKAIVLSESLFYTLEGFVYGSWMSFGVYQRPNWKQPESQTGFRKRKCQSPWQVWVISLSKDWLLNSQVGVA